jgi:25S rRNA (uracil2634-N3)-methyltransferase
MGKNSKHALKNTLHQQQHRLVQRQRAAQIAEQRSKKAQSVAGGPRSKAKKAVKAASRPELQSLVSSGSRQTIPFTCHDRILLIGEGNFSFTRALVCDPPQGLEDICANNITATAYDTEEECFDKYSEAQEIVAQLKERGVNVLFGVDATKLEKHAALKGRKWDKIAWNFPHAG